MKIHEKRENNVKKYKYCFKRNPEFIGMHIQRPNCPKLSANQYLQLLNQFKRAANSKSE